MRTAFDLGPYRRSTVGFDRLFDALESNVRKEPQDAYPQFDVVRLDDDSYRITLAVAGFHPADIEITAQQNLLIVSGHIPEREGDGPDYIHRGLLLRNFERQFQLADFVEVRDATYENGLLTISLQRIVPEALQPRKITIGTRA